MDKKEWLLIDILNDIMSYAVKAEWPVLKAIKEDCDEILRRYGDAQGKSQG